MSNTSLLERIKQLGFSEYEARCYLAVFERQSLTVSEVSKLAGIPRSNAYEAMERLLSKGLVVSIPGKMKRYSASDPWILREKSLESVSTSMESELEALERRRKEILDMKIREMIDRKKAIQENIDGVTSELELLYKGSRLNGSPLNYMEILKDPLQIRRKFLDLCSQAKKEILGFVKAPFTYRTAPEKKILALRKEVGSVHDYAIKRGIIERSIWEIGSVKDEVIPYYKKLHARIIPGTNRVTEKLPIKMVVFDRKLVLYQLDDPVEGKPSITSLVTEHPSLANAFIELFEYHWEKAVPMEDYLAAEHAININLKIRTAKKQSKG